MCGVVSAAAIHSSVFVGWRVYTGTVEGPLLSKATVGHAICLSDYTLIFMNSTVYHSVPIYKDVRIQC